MRKHIVFVFRNMGTGGAQKIEAFVANTLFEQGYKISILNMDNEECTVNINENIKIHNLYYNSVEKEKKSVKKQIKKLEYLYKMRCLLLSLKPDLICVFLSDIVRLTVLAMQGSHVPIVGSERGDPYQFSYKKIKQYTRAYNQCVGVAFQLKKAEKAYKLKNNIQKVVIENPCIPRKSQFPERNNLEHIIISAGRLTIQKRFDLLINAFSIVYNIHPEYKLVIYGDGPLKKTLENQIHQKGLENAVSLPGNVKDVFQEASSAEFFVLSSDFEGIPNILMEAMAVGYPCISTDCSPGGADRLLDGGKRGLLVPRDDSVKLADAMLQYIENKDLQSYYSNKSKEIIEEYEPNKIRKMWLEFFDKLL